MNYLNNDFNDGATPRVSGVIAAVIYFVVVVLSLWLTRCDMTTEEDLINSSGSLIIAFGDSRDGFGELKNSKRTPATASVKTPTVKETPILTDETSEVEHVQPDTKVTQAAETQQQGKVEAKEPEVAPRQVNQRALFPGTSNSNDGGQGSTTSDGVVGTDRGTPGADSSLGNGLSGDYSLAGRSLIGALPVPGYNSQSEGRVVVDILVDEKGRVTSASLRPVGSTTNDSRLVSAAIDAAKRARFSSSDSFNQSGTITYIFKMN
ncbi:MAG: TonB family protein [Rikenellaceae bacterium]